MTRLAVIGNPVAHSRSPDIHGAFALQAGLDVRYVKILAPLEGFAETVTSFVRDGGYGFNVTVPFKHDAFTMCDEVSDIARQSKTVNTVTVMEDARLRGDNTDGFGLIRDIEHNQGWKIGGKRILLLGAGGAISGVLPDLIQVRPASIHIFNRTHEKAERLQALHGGVVQAKRYEELEAAYDIIVSGTSAGLSGEQVALPPSVIGGRSRCYDMIYGADATPFNRWAMEQGCTECSDGLGMLIEQASAAFDIWFKFKPDTRPVIRALRAALSQ